MTGSARSSRPSADSSLPWEPRKGLPSDRLPCRWGPTPVGSLCFEGVVGADHLLASYERRCGGVVTTPAPHLSTCKARARARAKRLLHGAKQSFAGATSPRSPSTPTTPKGKWRAARAEGDGNDKGERRAGYFGRRHRDLVCRPPNGSVFRACGPWGCAAPAATARRPSRHCDGGCRVRHCAVQVSPNGRVVTVNADAWECPRGLLRPGAGGEDDVVQSTPLPSFESADTVAADAECIQI